MKTKWAAASLSLVIGGILCLGLHGDNEGIEKKVIKLSDHVYRVTLDYSLRPNIGVSVGPDGILLVDTGHQEVASELLLAIKNLKEGEIKYIINTHPHGDHAGGNKTCGPNAVVIGYKNLEEMVSKGVLSPGKGKIKGGSGKAIDSYYSMNFNGEEIRIIPSPGAHSDSDLIIHFTRSGVVHMGDLLLTQSFPAVGPNVEKYLEILDTVMDIFPQDTKFIGGHGRDYTMAEVKDYRNMLSDTIKIVRKGMKSGKSMEDMIQEDVLKDYKSWGVFLEFLNTDTWIEFIYQSYKN
jgi:cyclase